MSDVRATIREAVSAIADVGPGADVDAAYERVSRAMADRGLAANCHVGRDDLDHEETVEWYAGQFLDLVEQRSWFAMNSLINAVDQFAPEAVE